jgi:ASC-1-like (ASCH) protein
MSIHVAILKRPYLKLILSGRKTVESRLTRTTQPPYNTIATGERIFLKASSGPFMATALAGTIEQHDSLTPADITKLRKRLDKTVCGNDEYWQMKRESRYAVFVQLTRVEPIDVGPAYPKSMRAWHVVDDRLSPLMDITLTGGAIRNHYMSLPDTSAQMRDRDITLMMPDGREIATGFADGKPMLRWRGWGAYYQLNRMAPGDKARFVAIGSGRYRVSFHHNHT